MSAKIDVKKKQIKDTLGKNKNSIKRVSIAAFGILLQSVWLIFQVYNITNLYPITAAITHMLALLLALRVFGKHTRNDIKISWIVLLLVFPVVGIVLYVLFQSSINVRGIKKRSRTIQTAYSSAIPIDFDLVKSIKDINIEAYRQIKYITNNGGFPVFSGSDIKYFSNAMDGIKSQMEDMKNAKKYIFMEYHAIEDSEFFKEIEDILIDRVKNGVEVRILYDDVGSMGFVDKPFKNRLNALGIDCRIFNPVTPMLNVFLNNRDHRKITVIDGKIAYTGGYNIADEYFNLENPYGHWKDTGIRICGEAAESMCIMFLEMWHSTERNLSKLDRAYDYITPRNRSIPSPSLESILSKDKMTDKKISSYCKNSEIKNSEVTFELPFTESPLIEEKIAENAYLNMIKMANEYLYITTPYLLIDEVLSSELSLAAKRGVDVRIITPGIPDKKIIYSMTRSYYSQLARNGVRIYEYTPGFIHSKQFLADDMHAIIGTINLDYRSLYLHFENGVYLYNKSIASEMKKDFEDTFQKSHEVTKIYSSNRKNSLRIVQCILRLFAPMM